MKKILSLFIVMICMIGAINAQERINRVNGQITSFGEELNHVIDWSFNKKYGEWQSEESRYRVFLTKFQYKDKDTFYLILNSTNISGWNDCSIFKVVAKDEFLNITNYPSIIRLYYVGGTFCRENLKKN